MFIGRKKEKAQLNEQFKSPQKTVVLVYGKRRIGKSTLIQEAGKEFEGTVINHLCVKSSFEGNLELLCRSIMLSLDLPQTLTFATLFDLFDFLKKQDKRILLILDEYQYFKESKKDREVDSMMQAIIDFLPANIKLVFCGSYISIMKELLEEENPLFGRFTLVLKLEEFNYLEAAQFAPALSVREKIKFYSVFGGSPYVLSNLNYEKTPEENIKNLLLNENSLLRTYIENVMIKEIQKAYDIRILQITGNGKKRFKEIASHLGLSETSLLDKQLKNLLAMETITKTFPINKKNDKKKVFYEIKDNLMRFYFSFIFANQTLISKFGTGGFFEKYVKPGLDTFISLRFENIVNQYFMLQAQKGKLQETEDFGTYWYDNKEAGTNGQFDCVLKEKDGYAFYEAKFFKNPMTEHQCKKEEEQIKQIPEITPKRVGFVCSAGFDFSGKKYDLISGEDLYRQSP